MQKPSGKGLKYFAYGVAISAAGAILAEYVRDWMRKPKAKS
ncbi:structural protein [Pseudoalteromonas phage Cr39582]|mgnify:CR=1 FL=1|uniref:Protein P4 n=2 Tax=Merivirus TaxID=3425022 RepID=P4_BPPM2|nr:virion structural protein [Pseudoalteromonas phage PM2]YP_009624426.1 virion structural protein [Pseudoalteromonas phage Cr39582]Q37958.1 RecName: Full=Protein P4; AltName: Full=Protein IV [Pseudoalteromonas phage PM2]AAA32194.1 structural protein [Pseudoalteromonas phage PM2]AAD43551.1 structural protein P4 [Pseudoalteromonas phage PM2]AVJ51877.1 structural protein [Pseudoalteromonas phage Cr39582]|tara:strand:+ start:1101 stop:1223 length:123 start_codon:yes stop_codon:yes gene_type:complete